MCALSPERRTEEEGLLRGHPSGALSLSLALPAVLQQSNKTTNILNVQKRVQAQGALSMALLPGVARFPGSPISPESSLYA